MGETPLKHWNQKWNIECQCFISWKYWLSMHCVMKMKHGTKKRLKVNIMYAHVRARKERALTSSWRVLTSRQRVLTWGRRVPASAFAYQGSMPWQANTIHFLIFLLPSWGIEPNLAMPTRGRVAPKWGCIPPSEDASPAHLYIYAWNNPIYVLQHKT